MPKITQMNIAVIFTAAIVGGHELMAIEHIKKLQQKKITLCCYVPENNTALQNTLTEAGIDYRLHPVNHQQLEIVHAFFNVPQRQKARALLQQIQQQHDEIILIQGDIELGSVFVLMAAKLHIPLVSYIPYAHSFRKMHARLAAVKDALAVSVYRRCQRFITISECFAQDLQQKNPQAQVKVLANFVAKPPLAEIRGQGYQFVPQADRIKILMPGRVSFRQKGQDVLADALEFLSEQSINKQSINKQAINNSALKIDVLIAGDGPDLALLREKAVTLPQNITFTFLGWVKNIWQFADDVDFIVIPSKFEGVPLVMLEAQKRNIPIIASRRDGMKDYLPDSNSYLIQDEAHEAASLAEKIAEYINLSSNTINQKKQAYDY